MLAVFGAVMGSFAACQVWRLRYKETGKKSLGKFSVCLSCGKRLAWYENIPILSWVILRGRCRKCHEKIGVMEILSEVGLMIVFVVLGVRYIHDGMTVMEILKLVALLVTMCGMWILLLYDAKWGELPGVVLTFCNACAIIYVILKQWSLFLSSSKAGWEGVWQTVMAIGILAGTYCLLYKFSNERLVGGGDWILCLAVALILGNWWLAIIELFLANLMASVAAGPLFLLRRQRGAAQKMRKMQVHFGPFLVVVMVVVLLFDGFLLKALAF